MRVANPLAFLTPLVLLLSFSLTPATTSASQLILGTHPANAALSKTDNTDQTFFNSALTEARTTLSSPCGNNSASAAASQSLAVVSVTCLLDSVAEGAATVGGGNAVADGASGALSSLVSVAASVTVTGSSSLPSSTGGARKEVAQIGAPLAGIAAIVVAVALL